MVETKPTPSGHRVRAIDRLERRLARSMGRAIGEWRLIEEGDRILVGISGGKDSYTLLHLLRRFQKRARVNFDFIGVHLDQGQPGFDSNKIGEYLKRQGFEHRIVRKDTYSLVVAKLSEGETTCSLCSRYRRGILYLEAAEMGCGKIALGHHRDDAIQTLLLNMFFAGRTAGIPARLESDNGQCTVIRPMIYSAEEEIRAYAQLMDFPIEPCRLCSETERDAVATLLDSLSARNPNVPGNLLKAMRSVIPSHLLDEKLL